MNVLLSISEFIYDSKHRKNHLIQFLWNQSKSVIITQLIKTFKNNGIPFSHKLTIQKFYWFVVVLEEASFPFFLAKWGLARSSKICWRNSWSNTRTFLFSCPLWIWLYLENVSVISAHCFLGIPNKKTLLSQSEKRKSIYSFNWSLFGYKLIKSDWLSRL